MDTLDEQVIRAITNSFGKDIWRRALVVLTHAQLSPPDGIDYNDFFTKRSEALLRYIRSGAGINKREYGDFPLPIALVENSGRCKTNEHGEKILPDGTPWVPNLMKEITVVISNGSKPIHVDQKLIDGPNPNNRWKIFIPLILAVEYFLVVKGIRRAIHADIANGKVDDWEQRYRDLVGSRPCRAERFCAPEPQGLSLVHQSCSRFHHDLFNSLMFRWVPMSCELYRVYWFNMNKLARILVSRVCTSFYNALTILKILFKISCFFELYNALNAQCSLVGRFDLHNQAVRRFFFLHFLVSERSQYRRMFCRTV
ncbi:hypothetical protein PR202_ga18593 [Eleusine coracana subsp. coracana]|uniref:AIG1-type G domain-containing protein n=1 Tax=Eleusine coracana subsp. coracana TaxID=191504 RepID=A0AAV5CRS7_ELECO|nr:hypothetical protein PR202_ga18593 [Eleusine coracana subsp. coracana]